jgi:hypothetical protein
MNQSFYSGFIKRAQDYGLTAVQAEWLYKRAEPKLQPRLEPKGPQLQPTLEPKGPQLEFGQRDFQRRLKPSQPDSPTLKNTTPEKPSIVPEVVTRNTPEPTHDSLSQPVAQPVNNPTAKPKPRNVFLPYMDNGEGPKGEIGTWVPDWAVTEQPWLLPRPDAVNIGDFKKPELYPRHHHLGGPERLKGFKWGDENEHIQELLANSTDPKAFSTVYKHERPIPVEFDPNFAGDQDFVNLYQKRLNQLKDEAVQQKVYVVGPDGTLKLNQSY